MRCRKTCIILKSHAVLVILCLTLVIPTFISAQMKPPAQQLPGGAQIPQKTIQIDKQQATDVFYHGVKVEAVQLWPADSCEGTWQARISNPHDTPIGKSFAVPYQFNPAQNQWIEGPGVEFNLGKNEKVTVQGQWRQMALSKEFKVAFKPEHSNTTYNEKIIRFPGRGNPGLMIERFEVGDKYLAVFIKNTSQMAGCDLTVQKYTAKNNAPETFTPAGGGACNIPAGTTTECRSYVDVEKWKQGWDLVKIMVFTDNNLVLAEKIFPIP